VGLAVGLAGCAAGFFSHSKISTDTAGKRAIYGFILFFIAAVFISNVFSPDSSTSFNRYRVFVGEIAMFLLVLCLRYDGERGFTGLFLKVFMMFAAVEAVYGITEFIIGIKHYTTSDGLFNPVYRITGTLGHYNSIGGVLGMVLPIFFAFAVYKKTNGDKQWYLYAAGILAVFACIILTSTRGAWMGIVSGLTVMFVVRKRKLLLIPALLLALIIALPQSRARLFQTIMKPDIARLLIWESGIDMVKEKPLLGWGQDTFKEIFYQRYATSEKVKKIIREKSDFVLELDGKYFHAHNIFLCIMQESGFTGFFTFLFILAAIFSRLFAVLKGSFGQWEKAVAWGILGLTVDFLVHGLVDNTLRGETAYIFWFMAGLLYLFPEETEGKGLS